MQSKLTLAKAEIQVAESQGEAELARARKRAEQTVVKADGDLASARRQAEQTVLTAEASAKEKIFAGRGEGQRALQIGMAEAAVLLRKVASLGDPRLYADSQVAEQLAKSAQPLVPERLFVTGGGDTTPNGLGGPMGLLMTFLLAEKSGLQAPADTPEAAEMRALSDRLA